MGAYHALNLALKHPYLFNRVIAMSGRYDLTMQTESFRDLFDGYHDENIYFNMPAQYVANLNDQYILQGIRELEIMMVIGETDPFISGNRYLYHLMRNKGLHCEMVVWQGEAHRPFYWRKMVLLYL